MNKKGLILVFSTAIISGFSVFINKYGVGVANPYIFVFVKNAIVALALTSAILLIKDWKSFKRLTKKQWLLLLVIGLIGGAIPFLLFFKGLSITLAAQGAFWHKTMFVYVAILAATFLKEKISRSFLCGALLLILGSLLSLKALPTSFGRGDLMILLATFFWAIENIISKYALKDMNSKTIAWARMFFGSVFILSFLIATGQLGLIANLGAKQIGWTLVTSGLLFGYVLTWYSGLKYIPVSLASAILIIGSPITTLLSLVSGAGISLREIAAATIILVGLTIILASKRISGIIRQRLVQKYVRA
ncbi:MAG: DMT family transporter [Candidatus Portnoybacteria bacterium]|nr:DMT family transporter [Candidatus Portnoybacteria bacterium]